jgi:hypothetical protein
MLVRRLDRSLPRTGASRPGTAIPWFVILAPFLALLGVVVVYHLNLRHRQTELELCVEAAARDGAIALVSDRLLTLDPERQTHVEAEARVVACVGADGNRVNGRRIKLDPNDAQPTPNCPDGELVLGTLDNPFASHFDVSPVGLPDLTRPNRNAVRVTLKRERVAATATAFVDRDVIGFKLQGSMSLAPGAAPAILVVPFAISAEVWDEQITRRKGGDAFRFDARSGLPLEGADGIPELSGKLTDERVFRLAHVGPTASADPGADAARQLATGMNFADLGQRSPPGELLLNDGLPLANFVNLPRASLPHDRADRHELRTALANILGQPRVWMLYSPDESKEGNLRVIGFVAARLMHGPADKGDLAVVLQPCMLITATAVTDHTRRDLGPRSLFNPTIARVRLVD